MSTQPSNPSGTPSGTMSQVIARFALDLAHDDVPDDVVDLAKGHMLDTIGIALASSRADFGRAILAAADSMGRGEDAATLGFGTRLPAPSAALVNGTLMHGLDFDDTHIGGVYHASSPVLAAALATGERAGADGRTVLTAYIAGMEIGCRLAIAGAGRFHDRGFHPTALCGTFAAAAVAGRLDGHSHDALVNALGLCGSQAAGITEIARSWLKRFHPGWAAHSGLIAAAMGRAGFRGPATVFEGPYGFYNTHLGAAPTGADAPTEGLGREWAARGIALKPYPCCHLIHSFVDAALYLRDQVPVEAIARIDCPLTDRLIPKLAEPRERRITPPTEYDALFSVPYVVALTLVKGRVDLAAFYNEPLDDPEILAVAAKTFCHVDEESDYPKHFPGEVRVTLKDGTVLGRREATSRGTPERRLSLAEIEAKFYGNACRAVSRAQAERIAAAVRDVENCPDIRDLVALCVADETAQDSRAA